MAIPKTAALAEMEGKVEEASTPSGESLEKSHNVVESVADGVTLPEVKVFNDYVAVLLTPRESCIALPGNSEWSNIGVIVGVGPECKNEFTLGQNVVINPKGGGIVEVQEQGPAYEDKLVQLFAERNIFYATDEGPNVNVTPKS